MPSSMGIKLGTRVMMGIPTLSSARRSTQWIDCMAGLQMPLGSSMGRVWIEDETIAEARNALCKAALDADVEYLFMLGDDVLPPPNTLLVLLDKIGRVYPVGSDVHKASMLTGVYWTKTYPPEPYLFNGHLQGTFRNWIAGEFFPVDMAGCDCLLLETAMLKEIPFPWFSTDWVWEPDQKPSSIATEDFYFYAKARKHGFRLFADTSIQCQHEERSTGAMFGLLWDMPQAKPIKELQENEGKEVLIADLGSGVSSDTLGEYYGRESTKITRFDMREDAKPDIRCDIRCIDDHYFGLFDLVHASHVLEHFRRSETRDLVWHWTHLLKVGGKLVLHVPNVLHAMDIIQKAHAEPGTINGEAQKYAWAQIYGDQSRPGEPWQHLTGFTKLSLEHLLNSIPQLGDVVVEEEHEGQNLVATAVLQNNTWHESLLEIWPGDAQVVGQ